ncbi:MAG: hypothetical protein FWE37_08200, partial [Spirochaetaceae bacterium]|nr:hypothetical protein [Spirochaetaceae bacterium]
FYYACFLALCGFMLLVSGMRLAYGTFQASNLFLLVCPFLAIAFYKGWFWLIPLVAMGFIWGFNDAAIGYFLLPLFMLQAKNFKPLLSLVVFLFILINVAAQLLFFPIEWPVAAIVVTAYLAVFLAVIEVRELFKLKRGLFFALYFTYFIITLTLAFIAVYFYSWSNIVLFSVPLFVAALCFKSVYIIVPTIFLWVLAFAATNGAGIVLALLFVVKLKRIRSYLLLFLFTLASITAAYIINNVHLGIFLTLIFASFPTFIAVLHFKRLLPLDGKMIVTFIIVQNVWLTPEQTSIFTWCYVHGKADKEVPIPGMTDPKEISTKVIQERQKAKVTNRCSSKELAASVKAGAVKILKEGQKVPQD